MNDFFPACLAYTLHNERGFVDNPADRGGPTKFGITLATLTAWRGRLCTADDVRDLQPPEAAAIFRTWFWNALGCDRITSLSTAAIIFDAAVLFGVRPAAVCAQRAAQACGFPTLTVDGHVGPATRTALDRADPGAFALAFVQALKTRIDVICAGRPADDEFRNGWLKRVGRYPFINNALGKDENHVP